MVSHFWKYYAAALLASAVIAAPTFSQGNSQGKGNGHNKHDEGDDEGKHNKYGFGEHDREVITSYYSNRGSNLPPGLQKRVEPCPVGLERQLPPLPAEYRRGVIGAHIVIFNRNTHVIVDVLKDVAH